MITAKEAAELASTESQMKRFIKDIDKEIREAATVGKTEIKYDLPVNKDELNRLICAELAKNGYKLFAHQSYSAYTISIIWEQSSIYDKIDFKLKTLFRNY